MLLQSWRTKSIVDIAIVFLIIMDALYCAGALRHLDIIHWGLLTDLLLVWFYITTLFFGFESERTNAIAIRIPLFLIETPTIAIPLVPIVLSSLLLFF